MFIAMLWGIFPEQSHDAVVERMFSERDIWRVLNPYNDSLLDVRVFLIWRSRDGISHLCAHNHILMWISTSMERRLRVA